MSCDNYTINGSDRCNRNGGDECRFTLAEILRNIARYAPDLPVTAYLNVPSKPCMDSTASCVDLRVSGNAPVSGSTQSSTVTLSGTGSIPSGAIDVRASGTVNVPGLTINPNDVRTVDGVNVPVNITSEGTASIDLSSGTARGTIPSQRVTGSTATRTANVPISAGDTLSFILETQDYVTVPELQVCANECPNSTGSADQICGCMRFTTQESGRIPTEGTSNLIETPVAVETSSTITIPSSTVTAATTATPVSLGLTGTGTADVSVASVSGSSVPIPRLGVSGQTNGASGLAVASAGSNRNNVSFTSQVSGSVSPLSLAGTAATNGLPVTGTVSINCDMSDNAVSFTGTVVCSGDNYVTLRERCTNREIVISLCDISRISFASFQGMNCMTGIFEMNCIDKCSCAYGIQKNLHMAIRKPGTVDLYGSGTTNPIAEGIDARDIKIVDGGIIWVYERSGCSCGLNTVYSTCNIAAYTFTPGGCHC